jgi:hypothetical protein
MYRYSENMFHWLRNRKFITASYHSTTTAAVVSVDYALGQLVYLLDSDKPVDLIDHQLRPVVVVPPLVYPYTELNPSTP